MKCTGGFWLTQIGRWICVSLDSMKSSDECMEMAVVCVSITIIVASAKSFIQLDKQKADLWSKELPKYDKLGAFP